MDHSSLEELTARLIDLAVPPETAARAAPVLDAFARELVRANPRFGLIGREDAADVATVLERHILDSVAVSRIVAETVAGTGRRRLYDLGSGPGLPGVPLALVLPELEETVLVERRGKRIAFLLGTVPALIHQWRAGAAAGDPLDAPEALVAPSIRVLEADADRLHAREGSRIADALVVFRAYRQTSPDLLQSLSRTFGPGTPVCALKGLVAQASEELELLKRSSTVSNPRVIPVAGAVAGRERCALTWTTAATS